MADAVTVATGYPRYNVVGSSRELYYKFDIAADADYLDVPMRDVENVVCITTTDTDTVGWASTSSVTYGSRVVFDTAGAVSGVYCRVTGK